MIDPKHYRPAEVDFLVADATKARQELCWAPTARFCDLVAMMVEADLADLSSPGSYTTQELAA